MSARARQESQIADLEARVRALEKELREARNEAGIVRRAYLHERRRADMAGAPREHAYSGPADRFVTPVEHQVAILETKLEELEADLETGKDRERRLRRLLVRMHPKANAFWQGEIATLLRELEAEKRT